MQELLDLLSYSPTSYHLCRNLKQRLEKSGFQLFKQDSSFKAKEGQGYFLEVGPGAMVAWVHQVKPLFLTLAACHTESPSLRIKADGFIWQNGHAMAHVEPYGSPILASWFFKDLKLAGRVVYEKEGKLFDDLLEIDESVGLLLSPAIHLDREIDTKGFAIDRQNHLKVLLTAPVTAQGKETDEKNREHPLLSAILENLHKNEKSERRALIKLLSHDLHFYPLESAKTLFCDKQLIASARIDNVASVAAILGALEVARPNKDQLNIAIFADSEEIGSSTYGGAHSIRYLKILEKILQLTGLQEHEKEKLLESALLASVDGAHGLAPCYSELYEPYHTPILGKGPVLKYNYNGRYASDLKSIGQVKRHADKVKVPLQNFHMRADKPCGSTIGPILSTALGMPAVDLGVGQLAMHATRELMHLDDYKNLRELLKSLFENYYE